MKKFGLLLILCSNVFLAIGQNNQFSLSYYADKVVRYNLEERYSAEDIISLWDDYLRLQAEHALSRRDKIRAWLDLDDSFSPYNMEVAYIRKLGILHPEIFYRKNRFYAYDYVNYPNSYNHHLIIHQLGFGMGLSHSIGKFSFNLCPQFTLGNASNQIKLHALHYDNSNFRAIDEEIIRMENFRSLNMIANVKFRLTNQKNWGLDIFYELNKRRDWFNFENNSTRYEWTISNIVQNDYYHTHHIFDRLQNRFGFALMIQ